MKKSANVLAIVAVSAVGMLMANKPASATSVPPEPSVSYSTHVQTYGWQGYKQNGETSGTVGEAKRLEGMYINLQNQVDSGEIEYKTHVQTYGWEKEWKQGGEMTGTQGQAKRLEAIKIQLTGELAKKYDVIYRVHCQTYGWMEWKKNGELSGTTGQAKRLEAIQIYLANKNGSGTPPTEPEDPNNPIQKPIIKVENIEQNLNEVWLPEMNYLSGTDEYGNDLPLSKVEVSGSVDTTKAGDYTVRYSYGGVSETANVKVLTNKFDEEVIAKRIYEKTNELRTSLGIAPLIRSEQLDQASNIRSKELASLFSHTRPDGRDFSSVLSDQGIVEVKAAGENIISDHVWVMPNMNEEIGDRLFLRWKESSGHYANMVNSSYNKIGIAVYRDAGKVYSAQLFMKD